MAAVADVDASARAKRLDRVFHQVDQDLLEDVGVALDLGGGVHHAGDDLHRRRHELGGAEQAQHIVDDARDVGGVGGTLRSGRLQVGQAVDQLADAVDFLVQNRHLAGHWFALGQLAVQNAQIILDDRQRVVHFVHHPARRFAVFLGDVGQLAARVTALGQRRFERARSLDAERLHEALALHAGWHLPRCQAADHHAKAAPAGDQRHAHQAVGAEQAKQLFFGQLERLPITLDEGQLAIEGRLGDDAAAVERNRELGDALLLGGRHADQRVAGRVFQQDDGIVEVEQDARRAHHRFEQAAFALLAGEALTHFRHQHQVAHFLGQALAHRVDRCRRCIRRRTRDVVGAGQVDAEVGGRLLDLAHGGRFHRVDIGQLDAAYPGGVSDGVGVRVVARFPGRPMARHQVRQAHDADQRVARLEARARLMVIQHGVGQEGIEVPALDQPGACFGVGDLHGALLDRAQVFVVARGKIEGVFFRRGGQQRQAADIVQQAGQVSFLEVRVFHPLGQLARDDGGGKRTFPERAQVGAARMREVVKGLEHRFADDQRLDRVGAEGGQRLLKADGAAGAMVSRAVGHRQDFAGHAGIVRNERGQLRHAEVVGLQVLDQLDEYLRHRRQTGNQQSIANIMV